MYAASISMLSEAYRSYGIDFWSAIEMAQFGVDSVKTTEEKPDVPPPVENTAEGLAMLEGQMKRTTFGGSK